MSILDPNHWFWTVFSGVAIVAALVLCVCLYWPEIRAWWRTTRRSP